MKTFSPLLVLALCGLCFVPAVRADEVIKKNGSSVVGFIVRDTRNYVYVLDKDGRRHRIRRSEIESVIEDHQTGDPAVDAKLQEVDTLNADDLSSVARWAKDEDKKAWRLVAMQALRVNDAHEGAHELLGHQKVGDTWYESEREAEKARRKLLIKRRKEEGYTRWRGGWIRKEDRSEASKNPDEWMKDEDDTWVETAVHMKAKGFMEVNGKWVKAGSPQDKKEMEEYLNKTGEKIWVYSSEHFRLWVQGFEPDEVYEQAELCEKAWDWFHETYSVEPSDRLWRGQKAEFFIFQQFQSALTWYNEYRNRFGLGEGFLNSMNRSQGQVLSSGRLMSVSTVPNQPEARQHVPHQLVNHAAHCLLRFYSRGLPMAQGSTNRRDVWLYESFGVFTEHELLGLGLVLHTERQKYDGSGGVADKEFQTESAGKVAEGTIRAENYEPMASLMKIQLNSLTPEHMAKGYTIVQMLMDKHSKDFDKFLQRRNTVETAKAMEETLGMTPAQLDRAWIKYVRKKY